MHGFQSGQRRTSANVSHIRSAEIATSVAPSIGSSGSVTRARSPGLAGRGGLSALFARSALALAGLEARLRASGALLIGRAGALVRLGEHLVHVQQAAYGLTAPARQELHDGADGRARTWDTDVELRELQGVDDLVGDVIGLELLHTRRVGQTRAA